MLAIFLSVSAGAAVLYSSAVIMSKVYGTVESLSTYLHHTISDYILYLHTFAERTTTSEISLHRHHFHP